MVMNSKVPQNLGKKEYLKLFVFAVNPDSVWGLKLRRLKGLSVAEMGTLGKSARPCIICTLHHVSSAFSWQQESEECTT